MFNKLASAFIALCAASGTPCVAEALGLTESEIGIARVIPLSGPGYLNSKGIPSLGIKATIAISYQDED